MKEYQQKHMIRTLLYSKVTVVILFLLIILLLRSIMELNDKRIDVAKLRAESTKDRSDLEAKVAKAQEKNEFIATPRGFEAYVRTTYPVVKESEGVIVIYDENNSPVTPVRSAINVWERLLIFWRNIKL